MLGELLGLDESPPVSLAHASRGKPAVLVIDQVDCVSATSGRHEEFFDTLASLLDEVEGLRIRTRIHVILACRKFDYEHDHRLKRLLPKDQQPIELEEFSDKEVQQVIGRDGGDWTKLSTRQQNLLGLPQNLSLFVNAGLAQITVGFSTQKDLFDAYWTAKQKAVSKGKPEFSKVWLPAIKAITEAMSSRQELSLPASARNLHPIVDRLECRQLRGGCSENAVVETFVSIERGPSSAHYKKWPENGRKSHHLTNSPFATL